MGAKHSKQQQRLEQACDFEGLGLTSFPIEMLQSLEKCRVPQQHAKRTAFVRMNFNQLTTRELDSCLCSLSLLGEKRKLRITGLTLSDNLLGTVPWTLQSFRHLDTVYLHRNQLTEVPVWFAACLGHSLRVLTLAENPIKELPPNFELCANLEELYLTDTQIRVLPWQLTRLPLLRMLVCDNYLEGDGAAKAIAAEEREYDWGEDSLVRRCLQVVVASRARQKVAASVANPLPPAAESGAALWSAEQTAAREVLPLLQGYEQGLASLAAAPLPSTQTSIRAEIRGCEQCPARCDQCGRLFFTAAAKCARQTLLCGMPAVLLKTCCSPYCSSQPHSP